MLLTDTKENLIFRGIRPVQRLTEAARQIALERAAALGAHLAQKTPGRLEIVPPDPFPGDTQRGRDMIAGVFSFVGQSIAREDLSWNPAAAKDEWISALHAFEWLRDLRSVGGDRARRMAREMVASWIAQYQKYDALAWRADVMGARIKSWILFYEFFCDTAPDDFRKGYFSSLIYQSRYLAKVVPGTLKGIPLMKALQGLAYSGIALEDGDARLERAFALILRQIDEQILADGTHVSRSPQATFDFLQMLVDIRVALIAAKIDIPDDIQHAIDRMTPAVKFFRALDGGLSHFNGGREGNAHLCEITLQHSGARGKAMKSLPHAGYERITQGRASLIMDVGLPVTSSFSDRAHAGLLSFEYAYGRERVIVNCGTCEIGGKLREALRSTAAHSTVVVDNRNACQFDAEGLLSSRPDMRARRHEDAGVAEIEASHAGYLPRFGLQHRRLVRLLDEGETLFGEDILAGRAGVSYAVRFHLHPGIQASVIQDGQAVLLRAKGGIGWRFATESAKIEIEESVYSADGGEPRRTLQIVLSGQSAVPRTVVSWTLRREKT